MLDTAEDQEWNDLVKHKIGKTGTIIQVETSLSYLGTIYKRGKIFPTLLARLLEHLGVMYRGFLSNQYNKIWFRWKETSTEDGNLTEWNEVRIKPIDIKYNDQGYKSIELDIPGDVTAKARVMVGLLDLQETKQEACPIEYNSCDINPYPLKIYYQGNQPTQGVDIVVRGRVIKTSQFTEIWGIERHNDYNKFTGEIILEDIKFRTVNNKTSLDPNNEYTINLYETLRNPEEDDDKKILLKPDKVANSKHEESAKKQIKSILENNYTGSKVELERSIYGGVGVKVDIYHEITEDRIEIYEVKRDTAAPLDAYQLLMYWDGIVKDEGRSPALGRLIAKRVPSTIRNILSDMNGRKDSLGNKYNLEWKELRPFIGGMGN